MVATERAEARDGRRTWRCCSFESHSWLGGLCVAAGFEWPLRLTRRPHACRPAKMRANRTIGIPIAPDSNRKSHIIRLQLPLPPPARLKASHRSCMQYTLAGESVVNKYNYIGARRKAQGESLSDLVLGQQHVGDAAADLVDVLAVGADHLAFDDVDLSEASSKEFLARSKSKRQQSVL
ncbi:hypothetical protein L1887_60334 [Cichorium endivia]|nr:hypothetical protein L1887_60334 [Cichorium endivia]